MDKFMARASGSFGYEILADGEVVAWAISGSWAARIVELLEHAENHDSLVASFPDKELSSEA